MDQMLQLDMEDSMSTVKPATTQCSDATIKLAKVLNNQDELGKTTKSKIRVKIEKYNELKLRGNSVTRMRIQQNLPPL